MDSKKQANEYELAAMLLLQQMEDNQSQSYDQSRIQSLRRAVQVSKGELIKLAYDEQKLQEKIDELNRQGCECIAKQNFYEAIVYLNEAESVLEYAAGCGRTIDRTLIIATLHNQACVYQRIWELGKSSDYLEAIIYNISSFLSSQSDTPFTPQIASTNSPQHQKLAAYLSSKLHLISYNLQFCAVSSQVKNHENALRAAQKSLNWLKGYCEELHSFEKLNNPKTSSDLQKNLLQELQSIRNFENEDTSETERNIEKLMYKAKKSISSFQKKAESVTVGLGKEQQRQLENFSLGQVMQVSPISLRKLQEKLVLSEELNLLRKIYKAIYMSIAHFTMATELRLIANERHGADSSYRRLSRQFKESQVHHLVAVITVALYVPCYTKYFEHILNSFKNHYQIDLTHVSELSQSEDSNTFGDDLIHLQIQSISARDSDLNERKDQASKPKDTKISDKMGQSFQKEGYKTIQDIHNIESQQNSQNEYLKQLNRTVRSTQKKDLKSKGQKGQKKVNDQTSRQKQTLIVEKMISRSKSKGKDLETKRSKSRKSIHQVQEKERVVHYFQYDNYSKKVVKRKMKVGKDVGEYEITKRPKQLREKKSPQILINQHLKKLNQLSLSTKDLIANQLPKMVKKGKSPQLSTSRSQKLLFKKGK